jgi:rhodanese-related sulfurtransferase
MSNSMITLNEFHDKHLKLGKNEIILDVRNPDEYEDAHIKGALNVPVTEVTQHVDELKKYDQIYIHCKRGGRAKMAYESLQSAGMDNLVCVHDAGMEKWIESGFPTEKA